MDENEKKLTNEENIENPPENVADIENPPENVTDIGSAEMAGKSGDMICLNFFGRRVRISRKNWNRISLLVFCAAIIIVGVALAYFTSHDTVTNRVHSEDDINILLLEPAWDGLDVTTYTKTSTLGIDMAAEMQPGITIPKDPQIYNSSETAVYVRMKIVLYGANGEEITDADTISALLSSIYYDNGGTLTTGVQLIPTDYISESDGSIIETDENTAGGTRTYTDYNDTMQTSNSYGYDYNDGWFYYTTVLAQGERTSHLFDYIDVPVLTSEYKYFEYGFSIEIEAQAIDANAIDTTDKAWSDYLSDIVAEFTRKHGE